MLIEFKCTYRDPGFGIFCRVNQMMEWIYCVKHDPDLRLYLNWNGENGCKDHFDLFQPFQDEQILCAQPDSSERPVVDDFPGCSRDFLRSRPLKIFPADGLDENPPFKAPKYVYCRNEFYESPDFKVFCKRLQPIVQKYFRPNESLQLRIDSMLRKMNDPINSNPPEPNYKIGLLVRNSNHFQYNPYLYLDALKQDVDKIMESKDLDTTTLFLATICDPVVRWLSNTRYNVVYSDIARSPDVYSDWKTIPTAQTLEMTSSAVVDTFSLANCDELWMGGSNMSVFAGCVNLNLPIRLFPFLRNYRNY